MTSKNKNGFTLAELLVVVAIIAVLVAVSIPIFTSKIAKTKETTCIANRQALKHHISADYLSGDLDEDQSLDQTLLNTYIEKDKEGDKMCPSHGDYYFAEGGTLSGGFTIRCTFHDDKKDNTGNSITIDKALQAFFEETKTQFKKKSYDSTSGTENIKGIKEFFSTKNVNLGKDDMTTWSYKKLSRDNAKFYWTSVDISKVDKGTKVPVMCYNFYTKTYTVRQIEVSNHKEDDNPIPYNRLKDDGVLDTDFKKAFPDNKEGKQTYDNAYKYYEKAVKSFN